MAGARADAPAAQAQTQAQHRSCRLLSTGQEIASPFPLSSALYFYFSLFLLYLLHLLYLLYFLPYFLYFALFYVVFGVHLGVALAWRHGGATRGQKSRARSLTSEYEYEVLTRRYVVPAPFLPQTRAVYTRWPRDWPRMSCIFVSSFVSFFFFRISFFSSLTECAYSHRSFASSFSRKSYPELKRQ